MGKIPFGFLQLMTDDFEISCHSGNRAYQYKAFNATVIQLFGVKLWKLEILIDD